MLKANPQWWVYLVSFLMAFAAGAFISALLLFVITVALFGIGAATGTAYAFELGSLLFFKTEISADSMNMVFGPGFVVVVLVLGLFNALLSAILKRRANRA
jgi:hypothetical protein